MLTVVIGGLPDLEASAEFRDRRPHDRAVYDELHSFYLNEVVRSFSVADGISSVSRHSYLPGT